MTYFSSRDFRVRNLFWLLLPPLGLAVWIALLLGGPVDAFEGLLYLLPVVAVAWVYFAIKGALRFAQGHGEASGFRGVGWFLVSLPLTALGGCLGLVTGELAARTPI